MDTIRITTPCGVVEGFKEDGINYFLGIPYATAERFAYPQLVTSWEGICDAKKYGPAPINLWTLYGLTGIRIGGQDITPEQAGEATILDEDRNEYHIVAGQPLTFLLNNGQAHLHALVLTVTDTGFQFFDRDAGQVRWADYEDVQDIMKPRIQGLFDPDPE